MKTVVPYVRGLESMSPEELDNVFEISGMREYINNAPWDEFPYKPIAVVDLAASDDYLFARFVVRGLGLKAEFGHTNEPVWQDSCVEVFVGDSDGQGYRNFEVNCIGTLLSAHQSGRGVNVEPVSEEEADSVIRYASQKAETFSEKEGIHQWSVIIGIPFKLLGYERCPDQLKANFYKCADGSRWPHYLSWAPIDTAEPDFHRPEFFGTLTF